MNTYLEWRRLSVRSALTIYLLIRRLQREERTKVKEKERKKGTHDGRLFTVRRQVIPTKASYSTLRAHVNLPDSFQLVFVSVHK